MVTGFQNTKATCACTKLLSHHQGKRRDDNKFRDKGEDTMGLSNGWGDDIDEELQNKKKLKVGFAWNFISTNNLITKFDEEVGEIDDNYPKSEISKMWFSTVIVMMIFVLLLHDILCIVALPFLFFYGMVLFKISRLFKRFGYSPVKYWILAILCLGVSIGLRFVVWDLIFPNLSI